MSLDYSKLRGRIVEKFGSISAFAKAYGISVNSMSKKLNGQTAFSVEDITKMSDVSLLDIQPEQYHAYFFTEKVHEA